MKALSITHFRCKHRCSSRIYTWILLKLIQLFLLGFNLQLIFYFFNHLNFVLLDFLYVNLMVILWDYFHICFIWKYCMFDIMADSEGDSLPLLHDESKKRRLNDFGKCLICQEDSAEALRQAKPTSLATFISAAEARDDSVKIRLGQEIQDLEFKDIVWHAKCYANYTSKTNIMRVKKQKLTASASPSTVCESSTPTVSGELSKQTRGSRSQTPMTDWDKCLFCKQDTYKKDSKLINVASKDGCDTIFSAAEATGDAALLCTLRGVSKDLVAAEGKYHKTCRDSYVSKSNIKHKTFKVDAQEDSYANTMKCLGEEIAPSLNAGKAYNMNTLLQKYKILLAERGIDADSYSRQRLKLRLKNFFGKSIVFHQRVIAQNPSWYIQVSCLCRM